MPMMSDFKVLLLNGHVRLVPMPETTGYHHSLGPRLSRAWDRGYYHHVNKAKLRRSLLMDVDLLLGTEQALMFHFVSINNIIPCIFDIAVVINVHCCLHGRGGGVFTLHQIRELDGSRVGHVLAMAPSISKP